MVSTDSHSEPKTINPVQQQQFTQPAVARLGKRAARNKAVRNAVKAEDWDELAKISSQPGGFQEARTIAWPFLLHATPSTAAPNVAKLKEEEDSEKSSLPGTPKPHRDERQVGLDTNRAFVHYPVENQQSKERRRKQLTEIILAVLEQRPQLSYFQGYHDIVSTLQLTLHPSLDTDEEALRLLHACAVKISLHRARDAMGAGLEPLTGQLRILRRLLRVADPELALLIEDATPLPYWAISPLMTLYTHDLPTLELAQRVMDWILCRPPDAVIYLVAAFTLDKKDGIKQLIQEGDDGMMHSFLSNLPELNADELEPDDEDAKTDGTATPPTRVPGSVTEDETDSTVPSLTDDSSTLHSPTGTPISSGGTTPPIPEGPYFDGVDSIQNVTDPEKSSMDLSSAPAPLSPASSTSSLPAEVVSSNNALGPTVPLSSILQQADKLRDKYPISLKKLRLDETMGPNSMLRTWSTDPQQMLGDDAAEEAVLDTASVVLPDLDDDVFEPYPPPAEPQTTKTRLALLPRLDLGTAVSIGLPLMAAMFMVASNSPTTRAGAVQAFAFAYNFVEFIWCRLRFEPLPALNIYDQ